MNDCPRMLSIAGASHSPPSRTGRTTGTLAAAERRTPEAGGAAMHFLGAWALALYRIPVKTAVLMPGLKLEWLDADREHPVHTRQLRRRHAHRRV